MDFEHRIVAGYRFKRDIAVPCVGAEQGTVVVDLTQATALGLFFAADDRDLVTQFGALFCQGMNV